MRKEIPHPSIAALNAFKKTVDANLSKKDNPNKNPNSDQSLPLASSKVFQLLESLTGAEVSYFHQLLALRMLVRNGQKEKATETLKTVGFTPKQIQKFIQLSTQ